MKCASPFSLFSALACVMPFSPAASGEESRAVVKREFIFESAPFAQCHASTLVELDDALLAAWFGGSHEKHPDVGIWMARRDARTGWSKPVEVADGRQPDGKRFPCWNPVLFHPRTGPLMLFYKVGPSPDAWWGMLARSPDNGKNWAPGERLPDGILGPVKNKPVQLDGGDILSPSSSEHAGWRVHFERSSDLGKTWHPTPPVNDGRAISAIQPSILRHHDGRLQAIGRTRQKHLFSIESRDAGRTWNEMRLIDLPNPSSGTDALTLEDGRHLLVYNHTASGRSPLNVAISDDGVRWKAAAILENNEGEYSYPAVIQTRDGLVHITYTWKRARIRHVVLDVSRCDLRPMIDGRWPQ
jgi:predicted neuraminidase